MSARTRHIKNKCEIVLHLCFTPKTKNSLKYLNFRFLRES